jgi:antitoxin component YwqK of YwqJK toxin-antitoxin module
MKPFIIILITLWLTLNLYGQTRVSDSSSTNIKTTSHDTTKYVFDLAEPWLNEQEYYKLMGQTLKKVLLDLDIASQSDSGFTNKAEAKNLIVNGKKEGKWIEYYTEGDFAIDRKDSNGATNYRLVVYQNGKVIGVGREYYISGVLMGETPLSDGVPNGISRGYYPNGKLKGEAPYTNGKINGVVKNYYENGKLRSESVFIDDKENGVEKTYDESGEIESEIPYTMGKKNGVMKEYDASGKHWCETPYMNDTINGIMKIYYRKEGSLPLKLMLERSFTNGTLNGVEKWYYESGKLKSETTYTNGIAGPTKNYDENGNEIKQ